MASLHSTQGNNIPFFVIKNEDIILEEIFLETTKSGVFECTSEDVYIISETKITISRDIGFRGTLRNLFLCASEICCDNETTITLEGKHGTQTLFPWAIDGAFYGENGGDGENGNPGQSGGNIFVLTNEMSPNLKLVSKGGDGSKGQNGGHGGFGCTNQHLRKELSALIKHLAELDSKLMSVFKFFELECPDLQTVRLDDFNLHNNKPKMNAYKLFFRKMELFIDFVKIFIALKNYELHSARINSARLSKHTQSLSPCNASCRYCNGWPVNILEELVNCELYLKQDKFNQSSPLENIEAALKDISLKPPNNIISNDLHPNKKIAEKLKEVLEHCDLVGSNNGLDAWKKYLNILNKITDRLKGANLAYQADTNSFVSSENMSVLTQKVNNMLKVTFADALKMTDFFTSPKSELKRKGSGIKNKTKQLKQKLFSGELSPGKGGTGGKGGLPGCPGSVCVYVGKQKLSEALFTTCVFKHGQIGLPGENGRNGSFIGKFERTAHDNENSSKSDVSAELKTTDDFSTECLKLCTTESNETWPIGQLLDLIKQRNFAGDNSLNLSLQKYPWALENILRPEVYVHEYLSVIIRSNMCHNNEVRTKRLTDENNFQSRLQEKQKESSIDGDSPLIQALLEKSKRACFTSVNYFQNNHGILNLGKCFKSTEKEITLLTQSNTYMNNFDLCLDYKKSLHQRIRETKVEIEQYVHSFVEKSMRFFDNKLLYTKVDLETLVKLTNVYNRLKNVNSGVDVVDRVLDVTGAALASLPVLQIGAGVGRVVCAISSSCIKRFEKPTAPKVLQLNQTYDVHKLADLTQTLVHEQIRKLGEIFSNYGFVKKLINGLQEIEQCLKQQDGAKEENLHDCIKQLFSIQDDMFYRIMLELESSSERKKTEMWESLLLETTLENLFLLFSTSDKYIKAHDKTVVGIKRFSFLRKIFFSKVKADVGRMDVSTHVSRCNIKYLLFTLKGLMEMLVKGTLDEFEYQRAFNEINVVLEAYTDAVETIRKNEETIEMIHFSVGSCSFGLQVKDLESEVNSQLMQIDLHFEAEMLLLKFLKIEATFCQFTYPFTNDYLLPIESDVKFVKSVCNGKTENMNAETFSKAIIKSKEIIQHFAKIYNSMFHENFQGNSFLYYYFGSDNESVSFYTWNQNVDGLTKAIKNLFLGELTEFEAHIENCPKRMSAIKFNGTINLHFKIRNGVSEVSQEELNNHMKHFQLHMTHSGESHYKHGSQSHVIENEELTLVGSIETDTNICEVKTGAVKNAVRSKMVEYFYSPYTKWKFQLKQANHSQAGIKDVQHDLAKRFATHTDLVLVGDGAYLEEIN